MRVFFFFFFFVFDHAMGTPKSPSPNDYTAPFPKFKYFSQVNLLIHGSDNLFSFRFV